MSIIPVCEFKCSEISYGGDVVMVVMVVVAGVEFSSTYSNNMLNVKQMKSVTNCMISRKSIIAITGENSENKQHISSRFYRVLTMVYDTQNYWGFGLYPSSGF
jgi:hypothetical protein